MPTLNGPEARRARAHIACLFSNGKTPTEEQEREVRQRFAMAQCAQLLEEATTGRWALSPAQRLDLALLLLDGGESR